MINKRGVCFSEAGPAFEDAPKAHLSQFVVNKRDIDINRVNDWQAGVIPAPRIPPSHNAKPTKGCLKRITMKFPDPDEPQENKSSKHLNFAPLGIRCLITNTLYKESLQDGKAWRRQQSAKLSQERMLQALSGVCEYQPLMKADIWSDRGWESAGLGEDTPMGGVSQEQDVEAAQWRTQHMEFDQMLEDQQELAEQNRASMEADIRRAHGVHNTTMGVREFVRYRLSRMRIPQL